tara:strand:+ start:311 stop:532 length:222 start_codon:yes stop_codon:yes gene_type:complete
MIEKIFKIIEETRKSSMLSSEVDIKTCSNLRTDLELDSLALTQLAVHIEEDFNVDVFEDGMVETVQEIIDKLS